MKKKLIIKTKSIKKKPAEPAKGSLEHLSEYFGSYLSALQVVSTRQ